MFRKAVNEVEVEVAEELREVMLDNKNNSKSRFVELDQSIWKLLAWDHIVLQEGEQIDNQLLELEPFLIKGVILDGLLLLLLEVLA